MHGVLVAQYVIPAFIDLKRITCSQPKEAVHLHIFAVHAPKVCQVTLCRPLLIAVDGFVSYVSAFQDTFRTPLRDGSPGQPRLNAIPESDCLSMPRVVPTKRPLARRCVGGRMEVALNIVMAQPGNSGQPHHCGVKPRPVTLGRA